MTMTDFKTALTREAVPKIEVRSRLDYQGSIYPNKQQHNRQSKGAKQSQGARSELNSEPDGGKTTTAGRVVVNSRPTSLGDQVMWIS